MSSRTARNLVITAPDGTDVIKRTSGGYDTAGIIQHENGSWALAAQGWSHESVYNRTHAIYNRGCYKTMHIGPLHEQTAPVIRKYFGNHAVYIESVFTPDKGWVTYRRNAGRSDLRQLAADGIIAVSVMQEHSGLQVASHAWTADFQMDEIVRSMRPGKEV